MKPRSAKNKGARLQKWVCEKLSEITGIETGKDCDIESREMGQAGVDIKLYGKAKELIPFSIECKNAENWRVQEWIQQAKDNQQKDTDWLLVVKKNHQEPIIILDTIVFLNLLRKLIND